MWGQCEGQTLCKSCQTNSIKSGLGHSLNLRYNTNMNACHIRNSISCNTNKLIFSIHKYLSRDTLSLTYSSQRLIQKLCNVLCTKLPVVIKLGWWDIVEQVWAKEKGIPWLSCKMRAFVPFILTSITFYAFPKKNLSNDGKDIWQLQFLQVWMYVLISIKQNFDPLWFILLRWITLVRASMQ
jgi:hypothetical protein